MFVSDSDDAAQRPETGPMKFGDDWTGLFIRGDNALYYATQLNAIIQCITPNALNGTFGVKVLEDLRTLLCSVAEGVETPQLIASFVECKKG